MNFILYISFYVYVYKEEEDRGRVNGWIKYFVKCFSYVLVINNYLINFYIIIK